MAIIYFSLEFFYDSSFLLYNNIIERCAKCANRKAATWLIMLRIGVWFDERHCTYGGPTLVFLGTLLGFYQDDPDRIILLNEPGDVNWIMNICPITNSLAFRNAVCGPITFNHDHGEMADYTTHPYWRDGRNFVIASDWYRHWICMSMPFKDPIRSEGRTLTVWGAGVDIDFFRPRDDEAYEYDYFVYFKSQNYVDLQNLHCYLSANYFGLRGYVMIYYHYDPAMLRSVAQKSRFCFMVDNVETQGLAALEIMACDCPLFVIDATVFKGKRVQLHGVTSVTCMDATCGMKSSFTTLVEDFPRFMDALDTYRPREYVCRRYSYKAAARELLSIAGVNHEETS